ncbi:MAG: hypothetical protein FJW77_13460 [Actinobacteria bacterium]|nr:hypothetical protein [Actinomycetota bacterium]
MAQWDRHRVLAVGAHPDDIELGCGATLAVHRARGDEITLLVLTTGELGAGPGVARVDEQEAAASRLGATLVRGGQADGHVNEGRPTVEVIESVLREVRPGVPAHGRRGRGPGAGPAGPGVAPAGGDRPHQGRPGDRRDHRHRLLPGPRASGRGPARPGRLPSRLPSRREVPTGSGGPQATVPAARSAAIRASS